MKKEITILLLFMSAALFAQSTFSKRMNLDFPAVTFTSVEANDSCFYVSGIVVDSMPPNRVGFLFAKFDWEGNLDNLNTILDTTITLEVWNNSLTPINENFISAGLSIDGSIMKALIMKIDAAGDTIFVKTYENPVWPESPSIGIEDFHISPNGDINSVCFMGDQTFENPYYFFKTDSLGNFISENLQFDGLDHRPYVIKPTSDNGFIIGTQRYSISIGNTHIFKTDVEGEIQWEYFSPDSIIGGGATDLHLLDDGSIVFLSSRGVEAYSGIFWEHNVNRIDADQNLLWSTPFRDSFFNAPGVVLEKLILLPDNEHFVAAGTGPGYYHSYGKIIKGSFQGDSLWTRYIHHVSTHFAENEIYDMEAAPDGGFILCGKIIDFENPTQEDPPQQGWLLKIDEHGCLVPGCHLTTATEELSEASFQIKTYPNPATDYVHVYFRHSRQVVEARFQLIDVSGKVLLYFKSDHGDMTHIIPVHDLAKGVYWLRCQVGREVLTREIVVQ
jgi:hypothetical protein